MLFIAAVANSHCISIPYIFVFVLVLSSKGINPCPVPISTIILSFCLILIKFDNKTLSLVIKKELVS